MQLCCGTHKGRQLTAVSPHAVKPISCFGLLCHKVGVKQHPYRSAKPNAYQPGSFSPQNIIALHLLLSYPTPTWFPMRADDCLRYEAVRDSCPHQTPGEGAHTSGDRGVRQRCVCSQGCRALVRFVWRVRFVANWF